MGRPASYDITAALREATRLFRARGFGCVSVQDIVRATGLNRFALYEKFGSKEELLYAALDYYVEVSVKQELLRPLHGDGAAFDEVTQVLQGMRQTNLDATHARGCLVTNARIEFSGKNERVEAVAKTYCEALRHAFHSALQRAECRSELCSGRSPGDRAEYLVTMTNAFMALSTVSRGAADKLIGAVIHEVASWKRRGLAVTSDTRSGQAAATASG